MIYGLLAFFVCWWIFVFFCRAVKSLAGTVEPGKDWANSYAAVHAGDIVTRIKTRRPVIYTWVPENREVAIANRDLTSFRPKDVRSN